MTTVRALSELDGQPHANVFPDSEPKTVRLTLSGGEAVPSHSHPGRGVVLYLVEGALELELDDETVDVAAGDVVRFDGDRAISPRALEDSTALVVLSPLAGD